ncbi:acyl-CoA N-acyltransferase [Xylogone sp. PMI_703]|nr:acyl-CoA N-acyltransferase [Xylogone sp. PMI_703]
MLNKSPDDVKDEAAQESASPGEVEGNAPNFILIQPKGPPRLHPYTRPLTISDIDSVVALENAAFTDPNERATREKFEYRLTKCGELCMGIFCTMVPGSDESVATLAAARPVELGRANGAVSVLLGHIVAAKTSDAVASDNSMGIPPNWASAHPPASELGHQESGRTVVLHSIAVAPGFQNRGLGRVLVLAYIQRLNEAGVADRLALIAHDHKVPWYEKLGFVNKGPSSAQFGGGGWYDMAFELKSIQARTAYSL